MSWSDAVTQYARALKQGQKYHNACVIRGQNPYPLVLDEVLGERYEYIEHQLAHAVRDPNGRAYNRTEHLAERKRMMCRWADYLDELRSNA